jgi:hypothetical protein
MPTGIFLQAVRIKSAHNICHESAIYVTGFIYGDTYFVFSDTISYFIDCIVVTGSKIILSQRGFAGNGMSRVLFQELSKMAASTLSKGMFDETIILQRSLENSDALPDVDELLCGFSKSTFLSRDFHFI